jgi:tetratricopeptide (TPR) repeat protein
MIAVHLMMGLLIAQLELPHAQPAPKDARWNGTNATIEALAQKLEKAAESKSPLTLGHLYRLWNMNTLLEQHRRVHQALEAVAAKKNLDPLVRAHVDFLLASCQAREGKLDEANKAIERAGLAREAMLIGPFENSAGQGHDEAYPPEVEIKLDQAIDGKAHAVRWRPIAHLAEHGVFELSHLVAPSSEATSYVLVAVESAKPVQAALRTGSQDQLKVFLNGGQVYAIDTRRAANLDQDAIPIAIPQGTSTLLLKSSWTGSTGRLMFRLTAPDGGSLPSVRIKGDRASIERALGRKPGPVARFTVVGTSDAIDRAVDRAKGKDRAEALALRADLSAVLGLYDRRKLPTAPEVDLEGAIKLDPADPMKRFFYAHRAQERDPTLAQEQLEASLASDPGYVPSLFDLAEMARNASRRFDAEHRLVDAIARDPDFAPARVSLAALRFDADADRDLVLQELDKVAQEKPTPMLLGETAHMSMALEDRVRAARDAERALGIDFLDSAARNTVITVALDANDVPRAMRAIDDSIRIAPWQLANQLQKARALAASPEHYADSLGLLKSLEGAFPDHAEVPNLMSELLLFRGDKQSALAALERSLELDPQQTEVRRHRGALSGARFELEDEYGVDGKRLATSKITPAEISWGAIHLSDRTAIRLYENGQCSRFQQTVIRLRNPNMKDALRVHRIAYAPGREVVEILSAERIRSSGEILKASNISDDGPRGKIAGMYVDRRFKTIMFDDLDAGDVVNIRYRIDSLGQNIFGSFFGDIAGLQSVLPKLDVLYTVIAPKGRALYAGQLNAPKPQITEANGSTQITWSVASLDALEVEPFEPPYPEVGAMVSVSTYKSWADLGKWYAGLFSEQLELDDAARSAGKKAIAGAKTNAEKITRLYDYVVKNTRYVGIELGIHGWKPFKASEVHRRRYGDCKDKATLLAALLRDNGIDAAITLVRTTDRGKVPEDNATMWAFNHAITYVPSEDLYLDGTAEFSGSRELPFLDQGAMGLVVSPDGQTHLATLPSSKPEENTNTSTYKATLTREGALLLEGTERFLGARAAPLRQEFEEDEQRKSTLEKQLNQVFAGVHISDLSFSDLADLEKPVQYTYRATIDRYGAEEDNRYLIPVALFQHQVANAYASLASRKTDLVDKHPWSTRNVIRYVLPKGAVLESIPEGEWKIDSAHISLVQNVRRTPDGFETDDVVTLKNARVPAADYAEFRKTCLAIDRALGRTVVIKW